MPRPTGITLAVLLAAACAAEGPTHPRAHQTWALNSVDGQTLPAQVQFQGTTYTIIADTIEFVGDNDWERSKTYVESPPNEPELQRVLTSSGFVTLHSGNVVLDFECEDTNTCPPPATLSPEGDALLVTEQLQPPAENLVFHRVR